MNNNRPHFFVYETVDIPMIFEPEGCLESYDKVLVTMAQGGEVKIQKWDNVLGIDVPNNRVNMSLSQEETSLFVGGKKGSPKVVDIQVNIYYENGERDTTFTETIDVYDNQYKEVIGNE